MSPREDATALRDLVASALAEPATVWTLGPYGAAIRIAAPGIPLAGRLGRAVAGGALAFGPLGRLTAVAYETALAGEAWSHAVALCLPARDLPAGAPDRVTALGPDRLAVRPQDRGAPLFDLGVGLPGLRLCLRAPDPEAAAPLRARCGSSVLEEEDGLAALLALPCDRVALAGAHRAEAAPGTGQDARLQVLPKLLRLRRRHAATAPIPPGLVPIAMIQPPHPLDAAGAFDRARHEAFQALLARWGDPDLLALKRRAWAGEPVPPPASRAGRAALRVARAQAHHLGIGRSASA
ncbi:DUF6925 family protein [Methylobacterium sp. JK268]